MLSNLNLNQLRVFRAVYEHKSMTKAAEKIFLTQSGVSQHIKNFEDILGVRLFDRIGKTLVPTQCAHSLYDECCRSMEALNRILLNISGEQPRGTISLSAPPEFAHNVLLPVLAQLRASYPHIVIRLDIGLGSVMMKKLLDGEHDIAFFDDLATDQRLESTRIFDETILLCAKASVLKKYPQSREHGNLRPDLPLLAYLWGEPVLRKWYTHHFHKAPARLNVVAYLSNSQNIARMICSNGGAGILTGDHFKELRALGHDIRAISINRTPLINPITMNRIKFRSASGVETVVADFLRHSVLKLRVESAVTPRA